MQTRNKQVFAEIIICAAQQCARARGSDFDTTLRRNRLFSHALHCTDLKGSFWNTYLCTLERVESLNICGLRCDGGGKGEYLFPSSEVVVVTCFDSGKSTFV